MEISTLFVMLGLGLVHGLIPDEHTWPITIPYALGQENPKKANIIYNNIYRDA